MRDSQAFSSLVNAWVRAPARSQVEENANAEAAIDALLNCSRVRESLRLMRRRSEALLRAQRFARKNVRDMGGFYLVDGGRGFSRAFNVLGVVSTSLSHSLGSREAKPVFVLGSSKGRVELEARGTKELVEKGLDLSAIFVAAREARLLKRGGGHKVAAGAGGFAPSRKNAFFALVNRELSKQLSAGVN
jgi:hypothetical protein